MLSPSQITTLARKYQTSELNSRREYMQHLFLSYFYKQPQSHQVYFKGGTALRLLYQSPRFSEDLDFTLRSFDTHALEDGILAALTEIDREGIPVEIKESKKTSGGYLGILHFKFLEETIRLELEMSQRGGVKTGAISTVVNDFIAPYTVVGLSQEQLVSEKLEALLSRQKPRDFYDLYFMLRASLLSLGQKQKLQQALSIVQASKISFDRELKQFLPKTHWPVITDFKTLLIKELRRYI